MAIKSIAVMIVWQERSVDTAAAYFKIRCFAVRPLHAGEHRHVPKRQEEWPEMDGGR